MARDRFARRKAVKVAIGLTTSARSVGANRGRVLATQAVVRSAPILKSASATRRFPENP